MSVIRNSLILVLLFCIAGTTSFAQKKDSTTARHRKNVLRVNITNPVLFSTNSIIFGYERVLWKNQSVSLNLGQIGFGKFFFYGFDGVNNKLLQITSNYNDKGYHASLDYRFYLRKENRHLAPRGVYLAPYCSFNYFQRVTAWHLSSNAFTGDFTTTLTMRLATVGGQLGYQFILWKRLAIDLILIGPGITNYFFGAKFSTNLNPNDEREVLEDLYDNLKDRIVGWGWVMDGDEFVKSGSTNTTAMGFRYMIHLGFCF